MEINREAQTNEAPVSMRRGLLLALMACLGGCSLPLSYVAREEPKASHVQKFEERRLDQDDLKAFLAAQGLSQPANNEAWDLDTLALSAGFFSADFKAAEAHWRSAVILASGAAVTPTIRRLDTFLDHHSTTDVTRSSPWTLGLGFEIVLPDADRKKAKVALAYEEEALAKIKMAQVLWMEHEAVIRATIQFESAKRERELYQSREALLNERVTRLKVRLNSGLESPSVVRDAELSSVKAARDRQVSEQKVAEAARSLKAILHLPGQQHVPKIKDDLEHRFDPLKTLAKDQLQARALLNRLDLAEAEAEYRWSDARLRVAIAEQYPEITLNPGYEWDQNDHRIRLGVGLPINLPKINQAQILSLQEVREESAHKLMGIQEHILQDIYQRSLGLKEAEARTNAAGDLVRRLEVEEKRVGHAVETGDEDQLALTEHRIQANELKLQLEMLRGEMLMAGWQLELALAQPSTQIMRTGQ